MGGDAAKTAKTAFRRRPGDVAIMSEATALGIRMPPPMPVIARMATKASYLVAKALAMEKTTIVEPPTIKHRLWP